MATTVYDLIRKLSEYPADKEVVIDFESKDAYEGDAIVSEGKGLTGFIDTLEDYSHEGFKKVHILCVEV